MSTLVISDALVELAARRLHKLWMGTFVDSLTAHILQEQKELLSFLSACTDVYSRESQAVSFFLAEVIFESFRSAGRQPNSLIKKEDLIVALEANTEVADRVSQMDDEFTRQRYLQKSKTIHQPALIRYVIDVLFGGGHHEICPHNLPDLEISWLFIVLKSVIDVLDLDNNWDVN